MAYYWREWLGKSGQCQGFLEAVLCCLPSFSWSFPAGRSVSFNLGGHFSMTHSFNLLTLPIDLSSCFQSYTAVILSQIWMQNLSEARISSRRTSLGEDRDNNSLLTSCPWPFVTLQHLHLAYPRDHLHQVLISHVLPVSYCLAALMEDPDVAVEQHEARDRVHFSQCLPTQPPDSQFLCGFQPPPLFMRILDLTVRFSLQHLSHLLAAWLAHSLFTSPSIQFLLAQQSQPLRETFHPVLCYSIYYTISCLGVLKISFFTNNLG